MPGRALRRADPDRLVSATARVGVLLTPTAAKRLAALAVLEGLTRSALIRSALEVYVHAAERERRTCPPPAGPLPPPERATASVLVAVMPETREALAALAVRTQQTQTAVIRTALNVAAADCGQPPLFAARGLHQKWPGPDPARRPRGPAKVPGFARRTQIGLHRPASFMRKLKLGTRPEP